MDTKIDQEIKEIKRLVRKGDWFFYVAIAITILIIPATLFAPELLVFGPTIVILALVLDMTRSRKLWRKMGWIEGVFEATDYIKSELEKTKENIKSNA